MSWKLLTVSLPECYSWLQKHFHVETNSSGQLSTLLESRSHSRQQSVLLFLCPYLSKRRKTSKMNQVEGKECANPYCKHHLKKIPEVDWCKHSRHIYLHRVESISQPHSGGQRQLGKHRRWTWYAGLRDRWGNRAKSEQRTWWWVWFRGRGSWAWSTITQTWASRGTGNDTKTTESCSAVQPSRRHYTGTSYVPQNLDNSTMQH